MAVRTACSASSGRTKSAGGGWWPTRCSAARISTITARRSSSDLRRAVLLLVERFEPPFGRVDACLHIAHARGGIDQLLVERAAIVAERLDLAPELGLIFGRHPLVGADRIELLIALFDGIRIGLPRSRKGGRGLRRCWRARCLAGGGWLCAGGDPRGRILRQGAGAGQYQRQYRAEHEARIGATRAAGNHAVQG